ncbi:MAG: tryptophan 7-halogenase [Gemmatimonadota bacterium]
MTCRAVAPDARARLNTDGTLTHHDVDAAVLGSGAAGCAAASVLVRTGHTVALIAPGDPPAADLAVSIPPSAARILSELGFSDALLGARFQPNTGNTVWWAGGPARTEAFAGGAGVHIDRRSLERALIPEVDRRGARRISGRVRGAERTADGWLIQCDVGDDRRSLTARCVVDATGRQGVLTRTHLGRSTDADTTTLAIIRRYEAEDGWADQDGRTWIESHANGWVWSLPLSRTVRCVTVMLDQRTVDIDGDLAQLFSEQLARAPHIEEQLVSARPTGSPWACPASLYHSDRYATDGLVAAGDAGAFIDPLSSYGVKKALSSGWLAGITAHTLLSDPEMSEQALAFFDARERTVYARYRAASAPFFRAAAEAYGTRYWMERAEAADRAGRTVADRVPDGGTANHFDPDRLEPEIGEAAIRAAFEALKARDRLDSVPGATCREVTQPAIEGYRIVRQQQLASDMAPEGLRFVRDVDLIQLRDVVAASGTVPESWDAYNRAAPAVSLPDFLTALSTAFAAGFLDLEP